MSRVASDHINTLKQQAAYAAVDEIQLEGTLGLGTGSTVDYFLQALASAGQHHNLKVVASSMATHHRAQALGLQVIPLNQVSHITYYIDGADEIDNNLHMIKGGGGALTREKIVASVAEVFICIADQSKFVKTLGQTFPLPIEVLPMARSFVARELVKLGGDPVYREGLITDNGHIILDVYHLLQSPLQHWDTTLNQIPGVIGHGLFAKRPADVLLLGTAEDGIQRYIRPSSSPEPHHDATSFS